MRDPGRTATWVALALLGGCSGSTEAPSAFGVTITDSAGTLIVDNRVPGSSAQRWVVDTVPFVRLGALGSEEDEEEAVFDRILAVDFTEDGRIAVVDEGSQVVSVFSAQGSLLARWGGRGDGPAEFRRIRAMAQCQGDQVVVLDRSSLARFRLDGRLLVRASTDFVTPQVIPHSITMDCTRILGIRRLGDPQVGDVGPSTFAFFWMDPGTQELDTLGVSTLMDTWTRSLRGEIRPFPIPWGANLYTFHSTPRGVVIGNPRVPELVFREGGDRVTKIVRWSRFGAPVATADRRRYEEARNRWRKDKPRDPEIDFLFPELSEYPYVPDTKPVFDRVLADRLGRVWVRRFPEESLGILDQRLQNDLTGDHGQVWSVLDSSGVWTGDVELAREFDLRGAAEGMVFGVWTDSLGVQSVQAFRMSAVQPPAGG